MSRELVDREAAQRDVAPGQVRVERRRQAEYAGHLVERGRVDHGDGGVLVDRLRVVPVPDDPQACADLDLGTSGRLGIRTRSVRGPPLERVLAGDDQRDDLDVRHVSPT
jgi:hypothetical protein